MQISIPAKETIHKINTKKNNTGGHISQHIFMTQSIYPKYISYISYTNE